jgi:NAD(P)H-flavin reductase
MPAPGQYVLAHAPELSAAPLPVTLFASRVENETLVAAPPLPAAWLPGMRLDLRGPIGQGFDLPAAAHHLALACGGLPHRLLGLVERALSRGCEAVLFCDAPASKRPAHRAGDRSPG